MRGWMFNEYKDAIYRLTDSAKTSKDDTLNAFRAIALAIAFLAEMVRVKRVHK